MFNIIWGGFVFRTQPSYMGRKYDWTKAVVLV